MFHLPGGLLSAVCYTESTHDIRAIRMDDGGASSIGLCQVQLRTANGLGFKGTAEQLQDPITNTFYAGLYLRNQINRYNGDLRKGVSAYNRGSYKLDEKGQATNALYVQKVFKAWDEGR